MSEVYLVRHLHLDERRVIKVLRPEDAADPAAQARFLRAARTASQIKHRNVAILYDYSSLADGSFYMVWEYVDGQDVGRWLDKRGPFPLEVALDLGIQSLRGLEAIHSHGVVHRDISPDNLMLAQDARGRITLKIIDLGLAKNLTPKRADMEVTQVGMFMGKLRYCSPEQAGMGDGQILDHRSDLYSFAAVLYEMICGQPPFDSETPHGFVFKRLTEDPISLVGRVPGIEVSKELDEVLRVALERDRDKRFPSAVRLIEALEQVRTQKNRFSTQQIQVPDEHREPTAVLRPPSSVEPLPGSRSGSQLTKQERDELLNQINRASPPATPASPPRWWRGSRPWTPRPRAWRTSRPAWPGSAPARRTTAACRKRKPC
jgi:serine/threonine-protein kinase